MRRTVTISEQKYVIANTSIQFMRKIEISNLKQSVFYIGVSLFFSDVTGV